MNPQQGAMSMGGTPFGHGGHSGGGGFDYEGGPPQFDSPPQPMFPGGPYGGNPYRS
jgi:hypothetical protein